MKKVVAYCRVSTNRQAEDDRFGLEAQKDMIMKYCKDNNCEIIEWVVDEGQSGVSDNRPGLNSILFGETFNPPVEAIVCAKSDRLAREIKLYFYYKQVLLIKKIELISVVENFGEMGAFAPILEAFTMFAAEQERTNIALRTSVGRRMKAKRGGYCGGKYPFGYKLENGKMIINEAEADIVRKIFRLRQNGYSYKEIIEWLSKNGYKTRNGKDFQLSSIKCILDNRKTYEGYYHYGGSEWVEGEHEAIL